MEVLTGQEIYNYTDKKLNAHYVSNDQFKLELGGLYEFYKEKLTSKINDNDKVRVEELLFNAIKSQLFNGYHMAIEILNTSDIPNDWFTQTDNLITQQIPDLLRLATNNDVEGIITYNPMKNLISWLIVEYEGVYDLLLDISLNSAVFGAKWAFFDERDKREIESQKSTVPGLLANLDDVTYLNPQTYIICDIPSSNGEVWSIINSTHRGLEKIGEIIVMFLDENMGIYYMNIGIRSFLGIDEQKKYIDTIGSRLLVNQNINREQLYLKVSAVEEFYDVNNN